MLSRLSRASALFFRLLLTRLTALSVYAPRATSPLPGLGRNLWYQLSRLFSLLAGEVGLSPAVKDGMSVLLLPLNLTAAARKFRLLSGVASVSVACSGDLGVSPPDDAWSTSGFLGVLKKELAAREKGVGFEEDETVFEKRCV